MTGFLDGMLKWGAYTSATLFLLPSRQENFALSVAEAMHAAVPVVVSDRVNTWPYVKEAGAGIVLEEQTISTALAPAVAALLSDENDHKDMGRRGRDYAEPASHLAPRRQRDAGLLQGSFVRGDGSDMTMRRTSASLDLSRFPKPEIANNRSRGWMLAWAAVSAIFFRPLLPLLPYGAEGRLAAPLRRPHRQEPGHQAVGAHQIPVVSRSRRQRLDRGGRLARQSGLDQTRFECLHFARGLSRHRQSRFQKRSISSTSAIRSRLATGAGSAPGRSSRPDQP